MKNNAIFKFYILLNIIKNVNIVTYILILMFEGCTLKN